MIQIVLPLLLLPNIKIVPEAGLEPARARAQRILSPLRLPIPSFGHKDILVTTHQTADSGLCVGVRGIFLVPIKPISCMFVPIGHDLLL